MEGGGVDGWIVFGGPAGAGPGGGGGGRDARGGGAAVRGRPLDRPPLGDGGPRGGTAHRQADGRRGEAADRRRGGGGVAGPAAGGEPPDAGGVPRPAGGADRRAGAPLDGGPGAAAVRLDVKETGLRAAGQDRADIAAARAAWPTDAAAGVAGIAPDRLGFLDECGVPTSMARLHGRSPRGGRARGAVPHGRWTRLSVLGALGREGMLAAMSVEAAADGAVFHAHLAQVLLPELRRTKPDAALVMDNLAAHKTPRVRELLDHSGFPYRYLPSYSPDLSPIEPAWAQVKAELRRAAARDEEALHRALDRVSAANAEAYFRHCGYDRPD